MNSREDYDVEQEMGSVYLQREVADQLLLAISHTRSSDDTLSWLDRRRLEVAAQCLKAVFYGKEGEDE